jgi:hypothetical protein
VAMLGDASGPGDFPARRRTHCITLMEDRNMNALKTRTRHGAWLAAGLAAAANLSFVTAAYAGGTTVEWERIVGIIVPSTLVGRSSPANDCDIGVNCVLGTPASWVTTDGYAAVNLGSGDVSFRVRGLVLGGDPFFSNIGTTSVVRRVKGTLVCNDTAPGLPELVDTPSVRLWSRGNAAFEGRIDLPYSCIAEPDDIVFLIRIARTTEGGPNLVDLWNAFGAVRVISTGDR